MENTTNKSLATFLKEQLNEQDLIDLGLIRNPIYDNHETIKELKQSLNHFQDELIADAYGIEYAGNLTANDEPTQAELARALDSDDLTNIKEKHNPSTRRSNFWYVDKQRNEYDRYTIYHLANGQDRIIYDDELQNNPYFAYQRALSDAREDGDFDEYNRLKQEWQSKRFNSTITTDANEVHQCRLKVGTKLYGDINNIPNNIIKSKDKNKLISYLAMFSSPIRQLLKLQTKIKVMSVDNKCLAIL